MTLSSKKRLKKLKRYPYWVCRDCGLSASGWRVSTCSTVHWGRCGVCWRMKAVTQPRDFGYPRFEGYDK